MMPDMKSIMIAGLLLFFTACSKYQTHTHLPEKSLSSIGAKMGNPLYIRIFKEEKILELWVQVKDRYKLYKSYPILKTSGKLGPKQREGDRQNPEGIYTIDKSHLNPFSKYHLSMNIGYPNRLDRNLKRTGYAIMIHGGAKSIGCFAMGNPAIEEIYTIAYNALDDTENYFYLAIYPFKMTKENLERYKDISWYPFWKNLKEGYDLFERDKIPPLVRVKGRRYIFLSVD